MKLSNNKILITGGASVIGLGLTKKFIKEKNTVIICGRRESVLKEVAEKFQKSRCIAAQKRLCVRSRFHYGTRLNQKTLR